MIRPIGLGPLLRPLLAGLCCAIYGSSSAEDLPLPVPSISLTTDQKRNVLTWTEIPPSEGRRLANLTFAFNRDNTAVTSSTGFDPPAPPIRVLGQYSRDCDYFLQITKPPTLGFDNPRRTPPIDVRVLIRYQLWENTQSVGSPVFEGLLSYRQPGLQELVQTGVGPLGFSLELNDNITQPTTPLGTIPVTVSGLGTSVEAQGKFLIAAEAIGGFGPASPGSLKFRVLGPYQNMLPLNDAQRDSTMIARSSNTPIKVMNGLFVSFGEGTAAPGDSVKWTAAGLFPSGGRVIANLEAFHGYHVWRSDLPGVESEFTLLGEIKICGAGRTFLHQDPTEDPGDFNQLDIELTYDPVARLYNLIDRDVHDDFPYRYAVSTFDRGFLGNVRNTVFEGELATTQKIYPALQGRQELSKVFAVPNPYKTSSSWEEGSGKIVFANLPSTCTIRIYTVAGDLVDTIQHGPGQPRSTSPTTTSWDLVSAVGERIVPGIYIFQVDSPDFQQTGKVIVAR